MTAETVLCVVVFMDIINEGELLTMIPLSKKPSVWSNLVDFQGLTSNSCVSHILLRDVISLGMVEIVNIFFAVRQV